MSPEFLADTWWFALTARWGAGDFLAAARQRKDEGFTAVQLVCGVPPEVGPGSPHAASEVGPAWSPDGDINRDYLALARERVTTLIDVGLTPIVYGAWGHQIAWVGFARLRSWWLAVIETLDDLDLIWCLTGEADLWLGEEGLVFPDRTTTEAGQGVGRGGRLLRPLRLAKRRRQWSRVLDAVAGATDRPILLHPTPWAHADALVRAPERLAADAFQTGHDEGSREDLWRRPLADVAPGRPWVNLEPWYEGIRDRFYGRDQLDAYWISRLAGAGAAAYGAHGLWNLGDGEFLRQWGTATWHDALALETPRLLGEAHRLAGTLDLADGETSVETDDRGRLVSIARGRATYVPGEGLRVSP